MNTYIVKYQLGTKELEMNFKSDGRKDTIKEFRQRYGYKIISVKLKKPDVSKIVLRGYLKIADELHYGEKVKNEIRKCKTVAEISDIMAKARKAM